MDLNTLMGILGYKRQVLEQLLSVASIFGGFAVTGVIALRTDTVRDRVHTFAFGAMAVAAVSFLFATAFDAIWLPISRNVNFRSAEAAQAVIATGDAVVWAVLLGAVSLTAAVGLLGYARSRGMGRFVLALAVAALVVFALVTRALTAPL